MPGVEAPHRVNGPNTGRNSGGRRIKKECYSDPHCTYLVYKSSLYLIIIFAVVCRTVPTSRVCWSISFITTGRICWSCPSLKNSSRQLLKQQKEPTSVFILTNYFSQITLRYFGVLLPPHTSLATLCTIPCALYRQGKFPPPPPFILTNFLKLRYTILEFYDPLPPFDNWTIRPLSRASWLFRSPLYR